MDFFDKPLDDELFKTKLSWPPFLILMFLLLAIFAGGLISGLLVMGLGQMMDIELQTALKELSENSVVKQRQFVRLVNLVSHSMSFAIPAIFTAIFFYKKDWLTFLNLKESPALISISLAILLILAAFPFAQFTYWLNQQIPLPEWATTMERSTEGMIKGLLVMNSPGEFLLTLFTVAVLPALGEELVFRGIIQPQLETKVKNPHLAIWMTAIIFSAIHMQFEGFLARMFLGAVLGYLFYWTRNLWVPIIAHFFLNGSQVFAQYLFSKEIKQIELEQLDQVNWAATLISLALLIVIGNALRLQAKPDEAVSL